MVLYAILANPFILMGQRSEDSTIQLQSGLHKNSLFGNIGMGIPWVSAAASVSYDRSLFRLADQSDIRVRLSVGYLGAMMSGHYNYQSLTVGFLTGANTSHLELFAGAAINQHHQVSTPGDIIEGEIKSGIFPAGNIGYRFQKPQGWFIFRAGIGFPDLAYVGVGVAF